MSAPDWKASTKATWEALGLPAFCAEIGIDFQEAFLGPLEASTLQEDPFAGHHWEFFKHHSIQPAVFHMGPKSVGEEPEVWEEWFFTEGEMHHHVLRNHEYDWGTETWKGDDNEHPATVLNKLWYHHNCTNLIPTKLR